MIPRTHLLIILAIIVAAVALSVGFSFVLPDTVPTHWNFRGVADDFGSKWFPLLLMPSIGVVLVAVLFGLPLLGPFRKNFEQFRITYGRLCVTLLAELLALQIVILLKTADYPVRLGAALAGIIGLTMAVVGNWLGKVRRNFYIGIRTPWTLANDVVWERTHRLGGRLFVIVGLVTLAVCTFSPEWLCFVVLMSGVGIVVVWCVLYSLFCYRRLGQVDDLPPSA